MLRRLSLLLALEGLLLIVLGILYGGASLSDHSQRLAAETIAGALVVTGVGLLLIARGVDRTKGWTRSPAVVLNVFPIPIALPCDAGDSDRAAMMWMTGFVRSSPSRKPR